MSWTTPRDWTAGEIVTAAIMNTHIRDNERYLKGIGQVPTIESGLIIDNTDGDEYLQIPSLTTTERNLLTPVNGMIIYNETTTEFNKYENGGWKDLGGGIDHGGLDGLTDDDHTQYVLESILTTQGDLPYATAASTWTRLAKGTAGQILRMNAGATAPEYATISGITINSGNYTGDGNANKTIAHGLGATAKLVIIYCPSATAAITGIAVISSQSTSLVSVTNETAAITFDCTVTAIDATNFYVGNGTDDEKSMNSNGATYFWVAIT